MHDDPGPFVKAKRMQRNMTLRTLAKLANLSAGMISAFENHNSLMGADAMQRIANALDMSAEEERDLFFLCKRLPPDVDGAIKADRALFHDVVSYVRGAAG